ncbi:MAG TPA: SRPBCC domain-containing protein [Intrasporangium sp.]|nr:SRPBCC domain-containing protein [Intrasporangium sp.]
MGEPIVHSVVVAAAPDRAFEVFTEDFGRWWDPRLTAAPHTYSSVHVPDCAGEDVVFEHSDGVRYPVGRVMEYEPGRRFSMSFWLALDRDYPTRVLVDFEPTPTGAQTRVTLTQDGWTEGNIAERKKFTEWPDLLRSYAQCVEEPRAAG